MTTNPQLPDVEIDRDRLPPAQTPSQSSGPPSVLSVNTLLDQAYDEYCTRAEAGQHVETDTFLERYPTIRSSLGRLIELHHNFEAEALRAESVVWPKVGDSFHGFQLDCHLGDGASSRVFLARERALGDRKVAVKITRQADAEAYTLGRINHPNVIGIYSRPTVPSQDLAIICMEYKGSATLCCLLDRILNLDGAPKDASLIVDAARDRFAEETPDSIISRRWQGKSYEAGVREFFGEVCSALAYLHGRKILHRDLKPSNIVMSPDGSPVLLDFNLARDPQGPGGRFGGTYQYMPPEQLLAMSGVTEALSNAVDERSDIFAVGVLLWETLTGMLPFGKLPKDATVADYLAKQQEGFHAPMPAGWTVSPDLIALVRRCLALDPAERPASAAEVRRLLVPAAKGRSRFGLWSAAAIAACFIGLWVTIAAGMMSRPSVPIPIAPNRDRGDVRSHYQAGLDLLKKGDYGAAYGEFNLVVEDQPNDPRGWRARALALVHDETADKALIARAFRDLEAANSRDPKNSDFAYTAFVEQLDGNSDARSQYEMALKKGQTSAAVHNNLAVIYANNSGKVDDAIKEADAAVAAAPKAAAPYFNRGYGRFKKAVATPTNLSPNEIAELYKASIADYQKALAIGPETGEVHYRLAQAMASSTPPNPAYADHLAKAIKLGWAEARAGDGAFRQVRGEPAYKNLMQQPYQYSSAAKMKRLIVPPAELPEWKQ